jgi:hypothetical protein
MEIEMKVRQIIFLCITAALLFSCTKNNGNTSQGIAPIQEEPRQTYSDNSAAITISEILEDRGTPFEKPQYYIRSYGDFDNKEMDILKLDTSAYTAIETVGWSRNGLFAYRYKYLLDSGRITCWVYSLAIIDTITDKIIEEDSIEMDPYMYPEEMHSALSVEYKAKWNAILEKHNITGRVDDPIASNFQDDFLEFPITNLYCWLDYTINRTVRGNDSPLETDIIQFKLIVGNNTIQKIVSEGKEEREGFFPNISGRKILGYYKSPYENRIVVIVSNYYWDSFSGGYHTVGLDLFGCNMDVGLSQ